MTGNVETDELTQAVLAHEDVARYVQDADTRIRLDGYLTELRTTQRYKFYRALQHPLYPILRKVERITEHIDRARGVLADGHVVYVSNHKSHLDYLIELLMLDEQGVRPPLIAAGINLFGGALGLIHRHVTGAIPIRRGSKDPVYLATLKAYVAEILKRRDLLYYAEGGRSYTGELKPPKTGLLQAALQADRTNLYVVPMAIAYDIVLEEKMITREATQKRKRPFAQEVAEMIRHAVGYESRAFVTFGHPIPLVEYDPAARRGLVALAHRIQHEVGLLHKVLPTALVASALTTSMTRSELAARIDHRLALLSAQQANLAVTSGHEAVDDGVGRLVDRGVLVTEGHRIRVRDRVTLRYYARTLQHLLPLRRSTH
ncbi:MAG: 1-acyl-sn-glycerol-3-phosphate acyltransferase [Acidobacteria bacterium]|nr:1-acyl-sn-glycerol-3-phosphate acyltransferase [Acidobacteriota bacterium]